MNPQSVIRNSKSAIRPVSVAHPADELVDLRFGGTGSCPPGWNGWHLRMRLIASQTPYSPCCSMASAAYTEQVGSNRQAGGIHGEMNRL
jgi:hypothetical protein